MPLEDSYDISIAPGPRIRPRANSKENYLEPPDMFSWFVFVLFFMLLGAGLNALHSVKYQ